MASQHTLIGREVRVATTALTCQEWQGPVVAMVVDLDGEVCGVQADLTHPLNPARHRRAVYLRLAEVVVLPKSHSESLS